MNKEPFDIFKAVRTHNLAVDMCIACIQFYRKRRKPIKTIFLSKRLYEYFKTYVIRNVGEQKANEAKFELDSVNIELLDGQAGKLFNWAGYKSPELKVEFYETQIAQA